MGADLVVGDRPVDAGDDGDVLQRIDDVEEVAKGELAVAAAVMAERALTRAQERHPIVTDEFQVVHCSSVALSARSRQIGRAHVCNPAPNTPLLSRHLLENKKL